MHTKTFSFNNVVEKWKPEYMSIIFLTVHFQGKKGLRLVHYRYALVKNDSISQEWEKKMEEFFGWQLKQLYLLQEIKKCITTRQNLIDKLNKLENWGILKTTKRTKEKDYTLYKINRENYNRIDLTLRKNKIKKLFAYKIDQCSERKFKKIENSIEDYLQIKKPEKPKLIIKTNNLNAKRKE